jgi:hypothetical protein
MTEWRGFQLTIKDRLRSRWNAARFWLRNRVKFRRGRYSEIIAPETPEYSPGEQSRIEKYKQTLGEIWQHLSPTSQARAWSTFDLLNAVPDAIWAKLPAKEPKLLDAGCQDFSRAPAIQAFLRKRGFRPHLLGVELDAFTLLGSLHSRADRAEFFAKIAGESNFLATDFFSLPASHRFDCILCFYPFVSPHPALAWGLPYEFGDAEKWAAAVTRHLNRGGLAFVVHQGAWEESEFKEASRGLTPLFSAEFQEVFEEHEYPSRISVYMVGSPDGKRTLGPA